MIPRSIHSPEVADAAIATVEDAEALVAEFETAMSELMSTISEETALEVTTDGARIILTPVTGGRVRALGRKVMQAQADTLRKLAT